MLRRGRRCARAARRPGPDPGCGRPFRRPLCAAWPVPRGRLAGRDPGHGQPAARPPQPQRMPGGLPMTSTPATPALGPQDDVGGDELRAVIAGNLLTARERTRLLTESVDDADLVRQHSPLMSPLVWDLAHIANQEELWLLREVGGREPLHPEIDPLYDAFEHARSERPTLPLLPPAQARAYGHEVRGRVLDLLDRARFGGPGFGGPGFGGSGADARVGDMFGFGMVAQ